MALDEATRVRLSAHSSTSPEVLWAMAGDPSVTVRASLALNPATPAEANASALSPAAHCMAGQDKIEAVLLRHARALGADIRFGVELTELSQRADGVVATLRSGIR